MKLILFSVMFVLIVVGCVSNTEVEIEPGESAQIIIVEPKKEVSKERKKEVSKERWNWKVREYLRKEKKETEK